jgi:predicted dehydrogenase
MQKVKFGIIGTGGIAGLHAQAIAASSNAELCLVYDAIPERASNFCNQIRK